jgi:hypothetical protein
VENVFPGPSLGPVAVSAGYLLTLLTTMCRGSLRSLADGCPLMAPADWGRAKEAEVVKGSRPLVSIPLAIATLLAIPSLAAHSPTLLMTPRYLSTGGCGLSATIYYLSSRGLKAVHGLARARSLTHSQAKEVKESRLLASVPLVIATLLAVLGSAGPTLSMNPGYTVSTGSRSLSAVIYHYLSTPGFSAAHGPARARSLTHSHPMGPSVSATQLSYPLLLSHRGVLQVSLILL